MTEKKKNNSPRGKTLLPVGRWKEKTASRPDRVIAG